MLVKVMRTELNTDNCQIGNMDRAVVMTKNSIHYFVIFSNFMIARIYE